MPLSRISLKLTGLLDRQHAHTLEILLRQEVGVKEVNVNFELKVADVVFDSERVKPFQLLKTFQDMGCRVRDVFP
jgi:copper chaperone CopZ